VDAYSRLGSYAAPSADHAVAFPPPLPLFIAFEQHSSCFVFAASDSLRKGPLACHSVSYFGTLPERFLAKVDLEFTTFLASAFRITSFDMEQDPRDRGSDGERGGQLLDPQPRDQLDGGRSAGRRAGFRAGMVFGVGRHDERHVVQDHA
jgi:hypothetical protein